MRSTRAAPIRWTYVVSPNADNVDLRPRKADGPREINYMVQQTIKYLTENPYRVRVTQAYNGVKHTFGMQLIGGNIIVWDVNGPDVYKQPRRFGPMKLFIDAISEELGMEVEFREPTPTLYNQIKERAPNQMCVTYIDEHVIPNNNL